MHLVFIDIGSSIDILFYECFVKMELEVEMRRVHTSLFGFNGSEVAPVVEVTLPMALGVGPYRKVKMVRFLVVKANSSYNIILGRPSLNTFQAIVSTYHMKIKFPGRRGGKKPVDGKVML